ncbi:MAG: hypothetical protein FOGNACKC_02964 [Anaerolineae bacterium]|nr:hypothetical protein [Anaerolineae bacterium]
MPSIRRDLEQRAQEAILKNIIENYKQNRTDWMKNPAIRKVILNKAFFKPANALLIGGAILVAGCSGLLLLPLLLAAPPVASALGGLATLAVGLAAEAVYLWLAVNNQKAHAEVVADMLRPQVNFDPATITDKELRGKVEKAMEYWSLIDDAMQQVPDGALRLRLENTIREATQWLQAVYNLAGRVDKLQQNSVIERDLHLVPKAIEDYKRRLAKEDSVAVKEQLAQTIADKERQLRILQDLDDQKDKANYQLESTISSLGTIYSQLLLVGSKDEEGSRVNRLQKEISEQVHRLEDLSEAMDEVYQSSY